MQRISNGKAHLMSLKAEAVNGYLFFSDGSL